MAVYRVGSINRDRGLNCIPSVPDDRYLLDMAEEAGMCLPSVWFPHDSSLYLSLLPSEGE
ncbi:MAG: hypothetical protein J7647_04130 [Cyanobacteria bacterium SBLK]|nr:hypothetical protein [Cyanobacteria bacterium SBLK]